MYTYETELETDFCLTISEEVLEGKSKKLKHDLHGTDTDNITIDGTVGITIIITTDEMYPDVNKFIKPVIKSIRTNIDTIKENILDKLQKICKKRDKLYILEDITIDNIDVNSDIDISCIGTSYDVTETKKDSLMDRIIDVTILDFDIDNVAGLSTTKFEQNK